MSQKVVIPESVNCAFEAARLVSEVFLHGKISAWTASWRANENSTPSKWPVTRLVHIRARVFLDYEPYVFTCRVMQQDRNWGWLAESVKVRAGEEKLANFSFGPEEDGLRLEDSIEGLRKTAIRTICSCLSGSPPDYIGEVLARLPRRFTLSQNEVTGTWTVFFTGRGRGEWSAQVSIPTRDEGVSVILMEGFLGLGKVRSFVKEDGNWKVL